MNPAELPQEFESLMIKEAWERSCAGKLKYPSLAAAQAFAEMMQRHKIGQYRYFSRSEWLDLRAYKCRFSSNTDPHWHLGNI